MHKVRMVDITSFFVDLFVLFACAVIAGEVAVQLGQVAMVGQLLGGVVLGPTILGFTSLTTSTPLAAQLTSVQLLATIFILFMSGLEVVPEQLYRAGLPTLTMGLAIFFGPFLVTSLVAAVFEPRLPFSTDLYIGLTLSITALPVMGIMLSEFGLLRSKMGQLLIGAALINEFAAVTMFAILQQVASSGGIGYLAVAKALLAVALFISLMLTIHMLLRLLREARLWKPMTVAFTKTWKSKQGGFAVLMIMVVGSTLFSQFLGLTYVVGAFYAGLLVTRESAGEEAHRSINSVFNTMTWGFFVPLFFVFVGVEMNLRLLFTPVMLAIFGALLAVAIVSKTSIGAFVASKGGYGDTDALAIGFLLGSRGAVELAMATILFESNLISQTLFTIVAGVGLVTTIVAPIGAMASWLSNPKTKEELFRRVPSLRPRAPSFRHLRPPEEWSTSMSNSYLLHEWLENPQLKGRAGRPSDVRPDSGKGESGPTDSSGDLGGTVRPPLPSRRRPPSG